MHHTMNGTEIRNFVAFLQVQSTFSLADLLRDNRAWGRDAAVAIIEIEVHRRGLDPAMPRMVN